MSQAFIREGDDITLSDVSPTLTALIVYLTRGNNGIRVYEKKNLKTSDGRLVHVMSDGLSYALNTERKWEVIE